MSPPPIPEGLATKIGKTVPVWLAILAAILELADVSLSADTYALLGAALAPLLVTQAGRYAQGYAQQRTPPAVFLEADRDDRL